MVALTGAGVSAESGVPTFRGPQGLWRRFRPEQLANPRAFRRDPRLVWEWYRWRQEIIGGCQPNPGHRALAAMEREWADFLLVTQNIDGLHQQAGSRRVLELHGNLWQARCLEEGSPRPFTAGEELPPRCECGALLRPHVVWFGEALDAEVLEQAFEAARACQVLLVVGTSARVAPASALPAVARAAGATVVEVNPQPSGATPLAQAALRVPSGEVLPRLLEAARRLRSA